MNIKKLLIRALSGLVYVGIIVLCTLSGPVPVACLACLFALFACLELQNITYRLSIDEAFYDGLDLAGCVLLCLASWFYPIIFWLLIWFFRIVVQLYFGGKPIRDVSFSMMTQMYIALPLSIMVIIGRMFPQTTIVLAIFCFIWINDTGAFLTGSLFGRHKLFRRVSPKKTWEGFIGGLSFNLVAATLFCYFSHGFFCLPANIGIWLGLACVVTIVGTFGDLFESLIKRSLDIKDSGNIIPGHGGILDRIDSTLLVMPMAFIYLLFYRLMEQPDFLYRLVLTKVL